MSSVTLTQLSLLGEILAVDVLHLALAVKKTMGHKMDAINEVYPFFMI